MQSRKTSTATRRTTPKRVRPHMPSYGIAQDARGMIPWSTAAKLLAGAHNYWLTTVRPEGSPHSTAVWGVWRDDAFWFSCAPGSRKAKNIARDPRCTVTTERADEAVIIEGVAEPMRGRAKNLPFVRAYRRKYDWAMEPEADGYFVVRPRVAFAFVEHTDQFAKTATKYQFARGRARTRTATRSGRRTRLTDSVSPSAAPGRAAP